MHAQTELKQALLHSLPIYGFVSYQTAFVASILYMARKGLAYYLCENSSTHTTTNMQMIKCTR